MYIYIYIKWTDLICLFNLFHKYSKLCYVKIKLWTRKRGHYNQIPIHCGYSCGPDLPGQSPPVRMSSALPLDHACRIHSIKLNPTSPNPWHQRLYYGLLFGHPRNKACGCVNDSRIIAINVSDWRLINEAH